jgi:hypothetical protein
MPIEHEHDVTKVRTEDVEPEREERIFTFKATSLVWFLVGLLEALFALRILLKLIAANTASPIVALIYGITDVFLAPFVGLTSSPSAGGSVLEIYTLFAMVIYALIGWAIERIIWLIFYRPRRHITEVTESSTHEDHTHY